MSRSNVTSDHLKSFYNFSSQHFTSTLPNHEYTRPYSSDVSYFNNGYTTGHQTGARINPNNVVQGSSTLNGYTSNFFNFNPHHQLNPQAFLLPNTTPFQVPNQNGFYGQQKMRTEHRPVILANAKFNGISHDVHNPKDPLSTHQQFILPPPPKPPQLNNTVLDANEGREKTNRAEMPTENGTDQTIIPPLAKKFRKVENTMMNHAHTIKRNNPIKKDATLDNILLPDFYISDFSENEESSDGEPSGNFTILRNRRVNFLRNMRPNNSINYNTERPQVDYNKNFPNPLIKNRRKRADNSNNMAGQSRISHYENKIISNANVNYTHLPNSTLSSSHIRRKHANKSLTIVNGTRFDGNSRECYRFARDKSCLAGIFCSYEHEKSIEHRSAKVCFRLLQGACRGDDTCSQGPHSPLLAHQMPVCYYYLLMSCGVENCPYLHVKHTDRLSPCADFNRGVCQKGIMCERPHRYRYSIINEKSLSKASRYY